MKKLLTITTAFVMLLAFGCETAEVKNPVIKLDKTSELSSSTGKCEIKYSIENPVEGEILQPMTDASWIIEIQVGKEVVTVEYEANESKERRSADLVFKYKGAEDVICTLTQVAAGEKPEDAPVINVPEIETLSFEKGEMTLEYSIENPKEGVTVSITSESNWIAVSNVTNTSAHIEYKANSAEKERVAELVFKYEGAESVKCEIRQAGKEETEPSFIFNPITVSYESSDIEVIPADSEMTYIAVYGISKKDNSDEEFIKATVDNIIDVSTAWGGTAEDAVRSALRTGTALMHQSGQTPEKEYYIYVFGYTMEMTATTRVYEYAYTIPKPELRDSDFGFAVLPNIDYTLVCIKPEDGVVDRYYFDVLPKSEYEKLGEDPASTIIDEINSKVASGEYEYFSEALHNAGIAYSQEDLVPGEQYIAFSFHAEKGFQLSKLMKHEFVATSVEKKEVSFAMSVTNAMSSSITVDITPSDNDIRWFAFVYDAYWLEKYGLEGIADREFFEAYGVDGAGLEGRLKTGKASVTNLDMGEERLDSANTYIVGVFGVNEKCERVTDIYSKNVALN